MNDPFFVVEKKSRDAPVREKQTVAPHKQKVMQTRVRGLKSLKTSSILEHVALNEKRTSAPMVFNAFPDEEEEESKDEESGNEFGSEDDVSGVESDAGEHDRRTIGARLQKDALLQAGVRFAAVGELIPDSMQLRKRLCGNRKCLSGESVVAIAVHSETDSIFACSKKSLRIGRWSCQTGEPNGQFEIPIGKKYPGFTSLAVSRDGSFLVAGGMDNMVHVWNIKTMEYIQRLVHHRSMVTGVAFRQTPGPSILFTSSMDRTIKIWHLEKTEEKISAAYVDTLFGHQEGVLGLDSLYKERCVSVGGRDRSLRLWKVEESSQLVFMDYSAASSVDCVSMLNEAWFVTGSESGKLSLWSTSRKKPVFSIEDAHKGGIGALCVLRGTDVFASGGDDGWIRIWKTRKEERGFEDFSLLTSIAATGIVTTLSWVLPPKEDDLYRFEEKTEFLEKVLPFLALVVGVGREPRLGRWKVDKAAQTGIFIYAWEHK